MKATGIVRRIDELGRIVIPKEIRRTQKIREGDPLEIFTKGDGELILKKYSPINEMRQFADDYVNTVFEVFGLTAIVTDNDMFVSVSDNVVDVYGDAMISEQLEHVIARRQPFNASVSRGNMIPLKKNDTAEYTELCIMPILAAGEGFGVFILATERAGGFQEHEPVLANAGAVYLGKQLA